MHYILTKYAKGVLTEQFSKLLSKCQATFNKKKGAVHVIFQSALEKVVLLFGLSGE